MNVRSTPVLRDLVLIGGGHSHVTVLKRFGMEPMPGVRLTLICRDAHAPYSGMLPGLIAGHYDYDDAHIDLGPLARFAGARFFHDEVVGLDPLNKTVHCRDRPPVPYDVLSINIGSTPGLQVPGAEGLVVPVKPIDGFWRRWERLRDRCLARRNRVDIGVVGGGAGGVEILLAVQHRLRELLALQHRSADHLRFHLTTLTDEILPTHNERVRAKFRRVLADRGVTVLTGHEVIEVTTPVGATERYRLHCADRDTLDLDEVLWVTTARGAAWPGESGLDVDPRGFIEVNAALDAVRFPDIFAAGDIAAVKDHPRPKAGVFAVRQGPPLTANLRRRLLGEPVEPFHPQEKFLSLVSTGDRYAVASRGEWAAEGAWVWRLKDWIDRRFMAKFNELPRMDETVAGEAPEIDPRLVPASLLPAGSGSDAGYEAIERISALAMRCGGCGSKVGSTVLERALSALRPVPRDDVVVGLDSPDDAAVVEIPAGMQLVQTVDFFRAFIDDPFVFGQIAAHHALGDVFAMGAEPQTALAMVTIPYGIEDKIEADLNQLLAGALAVLNAENTALVGGHTSEGLELAIGFAVNGLVAPGRALGKGGMRPGDQLILTKPLGTGALFAADMRGAAKGRWIEAAIAAMRQSNRHAARCLIAHGAGAMTDVTGFGLLGHTVEMTRASGLDADLHLDAIPALPGALEVIGRGIFSSLHDENVRLRRAIDNIEEASSHPRYALLFDPQTAGGLLAGVTAERAADCINELHRIGYGGAVVVGEARAADASRAPIRLLK